MSIISFADFRTSHPEGKVLSRDTGIAKNYNWNPYVGYERADALPWFDVGTLDDRLLPKDRVVTVSVGDVDIAFPLTLVTEEKAINYTVEGQDIVVLFKSGTRSALDQSSNKDWTDVGSTWVYSPVVDGRRLAFRADGDTLVDNETGSVWKSLASP